MDLPEDHNESHKRIGITNIIRQKLNFTDERLWKRFSARRLEIIDTLDLSQKKASEQEADIKKVAELLRIEFEYSESYAADFDKLVRAAIQSVRRNRKRLLRSRKAVRAVNPYHDHDNDHGDDQDMHKKAKIRADDRGFHGGSISPASELVNKTNTMLLETDFEDQARKNRFVLEVLRLNSDSQEDLEKRYSSTRNFLALDISRVAIGLMIEPRLASSLPPVLREVGPVPPVIPVVPTKGPHLPGIQRPSGSGSFIHSGINAAIGNNSSFTGKPHLAPPHIPTFSLLHLQNQSHSNKLQLLHYFERLKTSEEAKAQNTEGLCILGRGVVTCALSLVLEKSFALVLAPSLEYIRTKNSLDVAIARMFRELDPSSTVASQLSDETAVLSFCTLIGSCVKDFGFDTIIYPLGGIIYWSIIQEYPLMSKNATPFRTKTPETLAGPAFGEQPIPSLLDSLAAIASMEAVDTKKKVVLHFLNSSLDFLYPESTSATPKLRELIKNGKTAFKLDLADSNISINVRDYQTKESIELDHDLETVFRSNKTIELEIYVKRAQDIPTHQITSTVFPSIAVNNSEHKILLPPPVRLGAILPIANTMQPPMGFKFLLNFEDNSPPKVAIPKFQPLL